MAPHIKHLALKGGGVRAFVHFGVAKLLDELGLFTQLSKISGSSAGAIACFILSTGWPLEKIEKVMLNLNFNDFNDEWKIGIPYRYLTEYGFYRRLKLYEWFQDIAESVTGERKITFAEWHAFKKSHPELDIKDPFILACNLNTGVNEVFSYKSQHKDVPICDAIRASIGIAPFHTPWRIKGNLYGDGGLQNNCPIEAFEMEAGDVNEKVLAVWIDDFFTLQYLHLGCLPPSQNIDNVAHCMVSQIEALIFAQTKFLKHSPYRDQIIFCDDFNISTLEFDVPNDQKLRMVQSGLYGALRYFLMRYPDFTRSILKQHLGLATWITENFYPFTVAAVPKDILHPSAEQADTIEESEGDLVSDCLGFFPALINQFSYPCAEQSCSKTKFSHEEKIPLLHLKYN